MKVIYQSMSSTFRIDSPLHTLELILLSQKSLLRNDLFVHLFSTHLTNTGKGITLSGDCSKSFENVNQLIFIRTLGSRNCYLHFKNEKQLGHREVKENVQGYILMVIKIFLNLRFK